MKKMLIISLALGVLVLAGCTSKPTVSTEQGASCGLTPSSGASCSTN